jgi:hypothetical protein
MDDPGRSKIIQPMEPAIFEVLKGNTFVGLEEDVLLVENALRR